MAMRACGAPPFGCQWFYLIVLVTSVVLASAGAPAGEHAKMLSGDEILDVLAGNTWYSNVPSASGKEYFREDGVLFGRGSGRDYRARWSIEDDRLHFEYVGGSPHSVFRVGQAPDGSILFYRKDAATAEYRGQVLSGNPFGL